MATKPVTVGVDGSEESLLAVEWAALEARRHGSSLRIVAAPAELPRLRAYQASPGEIAAALRGIAVGVRDPEGVTGTLGFAFEEAALRGADLVAVHTWYWLPAAPGAVGPAAALRPPDPGQISAEAARHLAAALEQWHGKYPEVRVRQDVVRGHPARVLASYSARADLVVMGRHGHPSGPGPGIGSIQHAVLDHAHGPVAAVPSGD